MALSQVGKQMNKVKEETKLNTDLNNNDDIRIDEWIEQTFPNFDSQRKQKLIDQLSKYKINNKNDLIKLKGQNEKIGEIYDRCKFDSKDARIFNNEIYQKIGTKNENKKKKNIENGETLLLTLNEKENDDFEHLERNKKMKQMKNNLKTMEKQLKNKNEISTDLFNKLKLESHEYFNEISEFTKIIQNHFTLLKDKNENHKCDIVFNQIQKSFQNFITKFTQPTNIFNQFLSLMGDHFLEMNEENKKLKNEMKELQINSQTQKQKIIKLETEKDKLANQLNQAQNNFQTKLNEYDQIINTKRNELIQKINTKKIVKIPLSFYSCKGHYNNDDKNHPNNLLKSDDSLYASLLNREFKQNENDWIIFSIDDNRCQSYFFKHFKITNCEPTWMQGVKKIGIWIGNAFSNEWFEYKPEPIDNIKNSKEKMQYEIFLNDYSYMLNKNKKFKFVKIVLYDNHGQHLGNNCKFAFHEFEMFGVRIV